MKSSTYLLSLMLFMATAGLHAQTSLTNAVDFDVVDINGYNHNLFDALGNGQYALINFFAHLSSQSEGVADDLGNIFVDFGCNHEDLFMLSIDYSGNTAEVTAFKETFGGNGPYISGDDGMGFEAHGDYGISFYPSIVLIAPDGSIVDQGIWPASYATLKSTLEANGLTEKTCVVSGMEELPLAAEAFLISPNPVTEQLMIQLDGTISQDITSVEVVNTVGQVVKTLRLNPGQTQFVIETADLPAGNYWLRSAGLSGAVSFLKSE